MNLTKAESEIMQQVLSDISTTVVVEQERLVNLITEKLSPLRRPDNETDWAYFKLEILKMVGETFARISPIFKTVEDKKRELIEHTVNGMSDDKLREILISGFTGYNEMDDDEIIDEWEFEIESQREPQSKEGYDVTSL